MGLVTSTATATILFGMSAFIVELKLKNIAYNLIVQF